MALLKPGFLTIPHRWWFRPGLALGGLIAPLVMALIYFLMIAPIGLVMRLLGKDSLNRRLSKEASTYWVERDDPVGCMKNQY